MYPSRSVAISGTLEYAEGAIYYDTRDVYRRWQPSAGLSWWITPGFELGLEYRFIRSEQVHR